MGRVLLAGLPSAERARILDRVELAAPGSAGWRPAGSDRRRNDRRVQDRATSGYNGAERRKDDRRGWPERTVMVYRVVDAPVVREPIADERLRVAA